MKNILKILSLIIMPIIAVCGCFTLTGCDLISFNWDLDEGFDTEDYVPPDYTFEVHSTQDRITVTLDGVGSYGQTSKLVALAPYQYLYTEEFKGLSEETQSNPIEIATYQCGTADQFVFDRYFDDVYDGIYYKYYILDELDEIIAGPMYCTQIEPEYTYEDTIVPKSIKGIMCEDVYRTEVADLGCSYTELNFVINGIVVPNEVMENGKIKTLNYTESVDPATGDLYITLDGNKERVYSKIYNGKKYYFRRDMPKNYNQAHSLDEYDEIIRRYTQEGIKVTLIVLMHAVNNQYVQPYFMNYPTLQTSATGRLVQVNTANQYGAGYWGALMEFLGERYSRADNSFGRVQTYVLGNEIDASSSWNNIVPPGHPPLTLENYVEEYEREMRIANQAIKQYHASNKVLVSITHYWTRKGYEYCPKDILDYMLIKTLSQGNYDYGFAVHPYGWDLPRADFWQGDLNQGDMTGSLYTSYITWSNLEVLELYLEQNNKLFNGQIRDVYLTEGGVASSRESDKTNFETTKNQQAAGVAYSYIKCSQLPCVKALIYYRLDDNHLDGAYFGLMGEGASFKKPSYNVYKYIDTQYWQDVANPYLQYISWSTWNGASFDPHGLNVGNVQTWRDTMGLFESKWDWFDDANWNEELIGIRHIREEEFIPDI